MLKAIDVVFPTKFRPDSVKGLLESLTSFAGDVVHNVYIIGDNPTEEVDEKLRKLVAEFSTGKGLGEVFYDRVITDSEKLAHLWNLGARKGSAEWILVFNDDCEATSMWVDGIPHDLLRSSEIAAIGPKIVGPDKRYGFTGYVFDLFGNQLLAPLSYGARMVFSPFPLVRRKVWEMLGGYRCTHSGRMYYEDADFGLRLNEAGYLYLACPGWVVLHCMEDSPVRDTMMPDIRRLHPEFADQWRMYFPFYKQSKEKQ